MGACSRTDTTDEAFLKRVNIEYSQKLWDYCTRHGIPFVYASSAATYGDGAHGYDDDEATIQSLEPLNLYGKSKQIFDLWALEQERAGHHPPSWAGFKFFNVYGFGERHKGSQASVVLHGADQIQATGNLRLFKSHKEGIADGHQMRDFVAVEDVIEVLHFAIEKPIRRGIFNLGTGNARTFVDLARAVFKSLGKPERIEFIETPIHLRDKYQYFTEARMNRLRSEGYTRPFLSLEEGVAKYIQRLL
jgi:ADP-L-glycero-D-manno-heptose 6-epimerase